MNKNLLYALWGGLFILCAGLGFIPEPEGISGGLMTALSVLFFLPPAILLYRASQAGDTAALKLVCSLSGLSLGLTLALLVMNLFSAYGSEALGTVLYYVLVIVSSPMVCSGHWAMSLFLWACLLLAGIRELKKK